MRVIRRIYNPIEKDAAIFLETSEESAGARTLIQIELAPGGGSAPHRHMTYAEHFEVLEGRLVVALDRAEHVLSPGDTAVAPAGALHNFRNRTGETVVFRVELRPGHRGFERALQVAYGLAEEGLVRADGTPKNLLVLALLSEWSEIRVPARLAVLARVARRRGLDRALSRRYVKL